MTTPTSDSEPRLVARLRARRHEHRQRGPIYRAAFVVAGFVLLLSGIAMLVLPGPAFVVIPVGLAILSLEFAWAEALLDCSLIEADKAKQRAQETTTTERVLTGIAVALGCAAFVAAAILYDIPVVPYL